MLNLEEENKNRKLKIYQVEIKTKFSTNPETHRIHTFIRKVRFENESRKIYLKKQHNRNAS